MFSVRINYIDLPKLDRTGKQARNTDVKMPAEFIIRTNTAIIALCLAT